ncbi:group I intron-associated PD-(D/E)XK endonuclease [Leucobacter aridicollis]|uniref:group I intron-associated PD-(D/E)XK endonuclease n=1 Tax=Leucobacter aridicollis TaxID=283878 RepID=UPI0021059BE3|nr:group I intron-associated PD-(D/E)XK endonuclease [Leucobacter aridicollis]UTX53749.1 hypothetical protein KI794_03165 [Leucobacter aridicollis]
MAAQRKYSDQQLAEAIASARSWRGVLRALGLPDTSSSAIRVARQRANDLAIGYGHFIGQRAWTEPRLRAAVASSNTWSGVAETLGIAGSSAAGALEGHCIRLGIDSTHFIGPQENPAAEELRPSIANLDRAGALLAASWFALCGHDVSWPLEPSRYDLLVSRGDGIRKVQVKTTTVRVGETWKVYLSTSRMMRKTYSPDEIDEFFVVTAEFECYLIPLAEVGGLHAIHLSGYDRFRVPRALEAAAPKPTDQKAC